MSTFLYEACCHRYAAIYDKLGFDAESFSDHSDHLISTSRSKEEAYANAVIKIIREQQPIVVHMFSNGGAWVWSDALRMASLEAEGDDGLTLI